MEISVKVYVSAEPVAHQCTLSNPNQTELFTNIGDLAGISFQARDVEGLPLQRGGAPFRGYMQQIQVVDGDSETQFHEAPVSFHGDGRYEVTPTLIDLGTYHVFVYLGEEVSAEELPS